MDGVFAWLVPMCQSEKMSRVSSCTVNLRKNDAHTPPASQHPHPHTHWYHVHVYGLWLGVHLVHAIGNFKLLSPLLPL